MAEPANITNNAATIYGADLLYEQNCKCGTIEVLQAEEDWNNTAGDGDNVWRIDILNNGELSGRPNAVFAALTANNISPNNCNKLRVGKYVHGQIIMGDFTRITAFSSPGIVLILYKDCKQS